jgi:hypothetical protein
MCSGNPAAPLPTTPSIAPVIGGQWAVLASSVALIGNGSFHCLPAGPGVRTILFACSIFHPPRFQADFPTS